MVAQVELIASATAFAALEPEWNTLLHASRAVNIFLTWEWVSLWWAVYGRGRRLHILAARDAAGALLGLAPLQRRGLGPFGLGLVEVAEFIGAGGEVTPERLDFIARRDVEVPVVTALADALARDPSLAGISLRPFAADSPNLPVVLEAFRRNARPLIRATDDSICPVLRLPSTWDAFLESRSRNYRKKIGEYERRNAREFGAAVRLSASAAEVGRDMRTLVDLHVRRWGRESRAFQTPEYVGFHREFAARLFARDQLRLFVLDGRDGPLAVLYCFALGGRYYYYQAGRDPERSQHRPGLVLLHAAIRHAIGEQATVFDFLTGGEAYKYIWAGDEERSVRVIDWRTRPIQAIGRVAGLLDHAKPTRPRPDPPAPQGGA